MRKFTTRQKVLIKVLLLIFIATVSVFILLFGSGYAEIFADDENDRASTSSHNAKPDYPNEFKFDVK